MSDRISPTAHITGYVWTHYGLAPAEFATREGAMMYNSFRIPQAIWGAAGGPTLDGVLLARHRVIDGLLEQEIESGRVNQIIEVAAGLSPRGSRFVERYGDRITYLETDLPDMASHKRELLASSGRGGAQHRVVELDAMKDSGPDSLARIASQLDPDKGLAIVTEGLINYFDEQTARELWKRFASVLGGFSNGLYLSDLHVGGENRSAAVSALTKMLGLFVRGKVHLHFDGADQAVAALGQAGFAEVSLHRPVDLNPEFSDAGARLVRVIEARVQGPSGR